jgi:hypothetical protein
MSLSDDNGIFDHAVDRFFDHIGRHIGSGMEICDLAKGMYT